MAHSLLTGQICCTQSMGKNSHRTATLKATRGQNKIIRELQGNAMRAAIKKDSTRRVWLMFIQAPRSWSEPKTRYNKSSDKRQTGPATTWPTKCSNTASHFSLMDTINGHLELPTASASSHLARHYHTQSQGKFFWKTIYSIFILKTWTPLSFEPSGFL